MIHLFHILSNSSFTVTSPVDRSSWSLNETIKHKASVTLSKEKNETAPFYCQYTQSIGPFYNI
jgi:hypothetical protein